MPSGPTTRTRRPAPTAAYGASLPVAATTPDTTPSERADRARPAPGRGGGGGGGGARPTSPRLTRRNSTVRSDSTDSIDGPVSISSSCAHGDVIGALRGDPELGPAAVGDDDAARAARERLLHEIFDGEVRIDLAAGDLEPQRFELRGEPRGQRIVVGHGQQHDTRPRDRTGPGEARATGRPDLRERRRAAKARPAPAR